MTIYTEKGKIFEKAVAVLLSISMLLSTVTGISLVRQTSAEDIGSDSIHFMIKHWHSVVDPNSDSTDDDTESRAQLIEGYLSNSGVTDLSVDGKSVGLDSENTYSDPITKTKIVEYKENKLYIYTDPYNFPEQGSVEEFSGFSVSAGHGAVSYDKDAENAIVLTYTDSVHLVKSHVFYKNTSTIVEGTQDDSVIGTTTEETDSVYLYVDSNGDLIDADGAKIETSSKDPVKAQIIVTQDGVKMDETDPGKPTANVAGVVKVYSTKDGLHTDKNVIGFDADKKTYDIELESWFVGADVAKVGMILDASGSMAFTSEEVNGINDVIKAADSPIIEAVKNGDLDKDDFTIIKLATESEDAKSETPTNTEPEALAEEILNAQTEGKVILLNQDAVEYVLDNKKTDNSKMSYGDYGYFIFDPRSGTNEYNPIGYWDKNWGSDSSDNVESVPYDMLGFDSLIAVYDFGNKTIRGADNDYTNFLTGIKSEFSAFTGNGLDKTRGIQLYKTGETGPSGPRVSGGVKLEGVNISDPRDFTISFAVSNDSGELGSDLLSIGYSDKDDKSYYNFYIPSGSKRTTLCGTFGSSGTEICNVSDAIGTKKGTFKIVTIVVSPAENKDKAKLSVYIDKTEKVNDVEIDALDAANITIANPLNDGYNNVVYLDNLTVFDRALTKTEVATDKKAIYNYVSKATGLVTAKNIQYLKGSDSEAIAEGKGLTATGWYYVNPTSEWYANYFNEDVGTAKTFLPIKSTVENPADTVTGKFPYYGGVGDEADITKEHGTQMPSQATAEDKDALFEYTCSSKEGEPLKFFINEENRLCCFYETSEAPDRYGWSYVYELPDSNRIKQESLQYAMGQFVTDLEQTSPLSEVSAVRFSNNRIPTTRFDTLVLQDWTTSAKESAAMLSLSRGDGTSTSFDDTGKNKIEQYNYGLTGGTYTWTGLRSYLENLDPYVGGGDGQQKYVIIFTDGKDSELGSDITDADSLTESKIQATKAYQYAEKLKENDYTIFTVMLASGSIEAGSTDYEIAKKFLSYLSGDKDTDPSDYGKLENKYFFSATNSTELTELFTENILNAITEHLDDYTVQDYIDPRFNLVDADGTVWELGKNGVVNKEDEDGNSKGDTIDAIVNGQHPSEMHSDQTAEANDGDLYYVDEIELLLSSDTKARLAELYYDKTNDMYLLRWQKQTVPACSEGSPTLSVWNSTIRVRAKDDFLGGNFILTNGNAENMNYVYYNGDTGKSSGTDKAETEYDVDSNSYPSKGFPRTTVTVKVPELTLEGNSQIIYMGEELTRTELAQKVGELIDDKIYDADVESFPADSWYWQYLDRYVNSNVVDGKIYNDLTELLTALVGDKDGITIPYYYLYSEEKTAHDYSAGEKAHENDLLGYLKLTWTADETDGDKDVTTTDTKERKYSLSVTYTPLEKVEASGSNRVNENDELISDGAYDSLDKVNVGPTQTTSDKLTATGEYKTYIVKGETVAELRILKTTIDKLNEHGYTQDIVISADLMRKYKGEPAKVGTVTFTLPKTTYSNVAGITSDITENIHTETIDGTDYVVVVANVDYTDKTMDVDDGVNGLPIGDYYLESDLTTDLPLKVEFGECDDEDRVNQLEGFFETWGDDWRNDQENAATGYDFEQYIAPTGSSAAAVALDVEKHCSEEIHLGTVKNTITYTDQRYGAFMLTAEFVTQETYTGKKVVDTVGNIDLNTTEFEFYFFFGYADEGGKCKLDGEYVTDEQIREKLVSAGDDWESVMESLQFAVPLEGEVEYQIGTAKEEGAGRVFVPNDDTVYKMSSGEYVKLKDGEIVEITLPVGCDGFFIEPLTGGFKSGFGDDPLYWINTYSANGELDIPVQKVIAGRNWLTDESYSFTIKPANTETEQAVADGKITITADEITIDSDSELTVDEETVSHADKFHLDFIDDGTYTFKVTENEGSYPITYSEQEYYVVVTATDDGKGNLDITAVYTTTLEGGDRQDLIPLVFTNKAYSDSFELPIDKTFSNGKLDADEKFVFTAEWLEDESEWRDDEVAEPVEFTDTEVELGSDDFTTVGTDMTASAKFENIKFYSEGTYKFKVYEDALDNVLDGVEYDERTFYAEVTVEADAYGKLTVTDVSYSSVTNAEQTETEEDSISFVNVYKAKTTIEIPVEKLIENRDWQDFDKYTVRISCDDDTVTFIDDITSLELTNKKTDGKFEVELYSDGSAEKTYTFTLSEDKPADGPGGITYADDVTVTVSVTDDFDGTLEAEITEVDGEPYDSGNISVINTYTVSENAVWTPAVGKTLTGRPWNGEDEFKFSITLDDAPDGVDKSAFAFGNATVEMGSEKAERYVGYFDEITFDTPGRYTFTISEITDGLEDIGITAKADSHKVIVEVADNYQGAYVAKVVSVDGVAVSGEEEPAIEFENEYAPAPYTLELKTGVKKELRDRDWKEDYTFNFTLALDPEQDNDATGVTIGGDSAAIGYGAKDKTAYFGDIEFTKAGTYYFTVTETPGKIKGLSYDPTVNRFNVKIDDDMNGSLYLSEVNGEPYDGDASELVFTFVNEPLTVVLAEGAITVTKELVGRGWNDSEFKFKIEPVEGVTKQAVESGLIKMPENNEIVIKGDTKDHALPFGGITFKSNGDEIVIYSFKISEVGSDGDGLTLAEAQTVNVMVAEINGILTAVISDDDDGAKTFTNSYKANGTLPAGSLVIDKELEGRDWNNDEFVFEIVGHDQATKTAITDGKITFADKDGKVTVSKEGKTDVKAITFSNIVFKTDSDGKTLPIEYKFDISERDDNKSGIHYDTHTYLVTVVLTDNGDGTIKTSVNADGKEVTVPYSLKFTNTYSTDGKWTPTVSKSIVGRGWSDKDVFTFSISLKGELPQGAVVSGLENNTATVRKTVGGSATAYSGKFGMITFNKAGEYTFEITEVNDGDGDGMTYSDPKTVTVKVEDDGSGHLDVEQTDGKSVIEMTNSYKASGKLAGGSITVNKELSGRDWEDTDTFSFGIVPEPGVTADAVTSKNIVLPADVKLNKDLRSAPFGEIQFNDIVFPTDPDTGETETLTYTFDVDERKGSDPTMVYDPHEYKLTVTLTDKGDGTLETSFAIDGKNNEEGKAELGFENVFNMAKWPPVVQKTLSGREWNAEDTFKFSLTVKETPDGVDKDSFKVQTELVLDGEDGGTTYYGRFSPIEFTTAGTYVFELSEVQGDDADIVYDGTVYTITVKVTADGNGSLSAELESAPGISESGWFAFNNRYEPKAPLTPAELDGAAELNVTKVLEGRDWTTGDSFKFTITADEKYDSVQFLGDTEIEITDTTKDHTAHFGNIKFTEAGTFNFTVTENGGGSTVKGVAYKEQDYPITVTVSEKDGALIASVEGNDDLTFTNTYSASVKWQLALSKLIANKPWQEGEEFTFKIAAGDDDTKAALGKSVIMPQNDTLVLTSEKREGLFDAIEFKSNNSRLTTYTFIVTEQDGGDKSIKYAEPVTVTVQVADNYSGAMSATAVGLENNKVTVENTYIATGTLAGTEFTVEKLLSGREWIDGLDNYSFTLAPYGDETVQAAESGLITFGSTSATIDPVTHKAAFGDITFAATGKDKTEYSFIISENTDELPLGVEAVTGERIFTVTVSDSFDGAITAEITDMPEEGLTFTNKYTSTCQWPPVVNKTLVGRPWQEGERFGFELTLTDTPDGVESSDVKVPDILWIGKGSEEQDSYSGQFVPAEFSAKGLYTFTLVELQGNDAEMTYDENVYTIKVDVDYDEQGALQAQVVEVYDSTNKELDIEEFDFVNTYEKSDDKTPDDETPADSSKPESSDDGIISPDDHDNNAPSDNPITGIALETGAAAAGAALLAISIALRKKRKDD